MSVLPMEMVKQSLQAGHMTSESAIPWIRDTFSYSMKRPTYGRLRTVVLRKNPEFKDGPTKSDPPTPETRDKDDVEEVLGKFTNKVRLAILVAELLDEFDPTEILETVAVVAIVRNRKPCD